MQSFQGIEEFIAVVETGSFTGAAARLCVSKSVISKHIQLLEQLLSATLLLRTTRRLSLTPSGEVFYRHCSMMARTLAEAKIDVARMQDEAVGTIRIGVSNLHGAEFMSRAISEFMLLHRQLVVEVIARPTPMDPIQEGCDVVIAYGRLADSSLFARRIGYLSLCLCAAPSYLQERGIPRSVEELAAHDCLHDGSGYWHFNATEPGSTRRVPVTGRWIANDGLATLHAAATGVGIAQLPLAIIDREVAQGRLASIEGDWSLLDRDVWALYAYGRDVPLPVRLLLDYITSRFEHVRLRQSGPVDGWRDP
jgi:DNA-binding transcriptional LysR family regulator